MKLFFRLKGACCDLLQSAHLLGGEDGPASRRGIFASSLAYNVVINVLNGTYLTGFILSIGADANGVNLVVALLSLCNLVQLVAPLFLERLSRHKPFLIALRAGAHCVNILVIPGLALAGVPKDVLLPLVMALLALSQCVLAFISPGVQVWHLGSLPGETRLGYFSFFNVINCITTYVALFLSGLLADGLTATLGSHLALPLLRTVMLLFAAADILFLTKVRELPVKREQPQSLARFFAGMLRCIRSCPAYGKVIAVASLWNFAANLPSQYYTAYLIEDLQMSYTFISCVGLFNVLAVILFTPFWKRLLQKRGLRSGLFLSVLLYAPHAVGLALTGPGNVWLYPVTVLYSLIFAVGINLSFSMIPYLNLPEERRTVYMAFYNTCCALSALLGILAGRVIFSATRDLGPLMLAGGEIAPARVLVTVYAGMLLLASFVFRRLLRNAE